MYGIEPDWKAKPKKPPAPKKPEVLWSAEARKVRRYLLTAAQDETSVHQPFWQNLQAYAAHIGAEIMIGGFCYQKKLFTDHMVRTGVFASELVPFFRAEVLELAPKMVWYGAANILPTTSDPLAGWDTNTREKWACFPHAKIALKSIPVMPGAPGKQIMTTGVVTKANYIQKNLGQRSEFHHTLGAVVVEVAPDGVHFCRHLSAHPRDGAFQDLDIVVSDGTITKGNRVECVTYGDIHIEKIDPDVAKGTWGYDAESGICDVGGSMLDTLKPLESHYHDSFDFTARSHHTRNDPHERARRIAEKMDEVESAIVVASMFLSETRRPWCRSVHIASNHNLHMDRWLKDQSGLGDPVNAAYWCELNAAQFRAIQGLDDRFQVHEYALRRASKDGLDKIVFLHEGESHKICRRIAPIECGLHGHIGPSGARGTALNLARIVERVNIADKHTPTIREACYVAGTSSLLDMVSNTRGPGAWMHSHIVTYPSSKRAIITMHGDRWRA